jgi:phage RecT family recombinase
MAKSFIRPAVQQQPPSAPVSAKDHQPVIPAGQPPSPQLQTQRTWTPRNQQNEQLPNYETAIIEALKQPDYIADIARILKDRKEANIDAEEFIGQAIRQIQCAEYDSHVKLVQCLSGSVQTAVRKLATMGLSPNAELGEGWLVPRYNKKAGAFQATAVPGVRGMERKLMETGKVANIEARAIFLQDVCKVKLGTENLIEHEINFIPDQARPNPIIGAYGIVTLKDGRREIAVKRLYAQGADNRQRQGQDEGQERGRAFMDDETAARYSAQRPAMKGALNKFFKEDRALQALIQMENESYELSVNGEAATREVTLRVDPTSQSIQIPRAQLGDSLPPARSVEQPQEEHRAGAEEIRQLESDRSQTTMVARSAKPQEPQKPQHPADDIFRQVQHEYRDPDPTEGHQMRR